MLTTDWPEASGLKFLNAFSPLRSGSAYLAMENARRAFEAFLRGEELCYVNGTAFNRLQCESVVNVLKGYAQLYITSFESAVVQPFGLTWMDGAGLFRKGRVGEFLGHWREGHDCIFGGYLAPKRTRRTRGDQKWKTAVAFLARQGDNGIVWTVLSYWRATD